MDRAIGMYIYYNNDHVTANWVVIVLFHDY